MNLAAFRPVKKQAEPNVSYFTRVWGAEVVAALSGCGSAGEYSVRIGPFGLNRAAADASVRKWQLA
jgi:hypothetical protein